MTYCRFIIIIFKIILLLLLILISNIKIKRVCLKLLNKFTCISEYIIIIFQVTWYAFPDKKLLHRYVRLFAALLSLSVMLHECNMYIMCHSSSLSGWSNMGSISTRLRYSGNNN